MENDNKPRNIFTGPMDAQIPGLNFAMNYAFYKCGGTRKQDGHFIMGFMVGMGGHSVHRGSGESYEKFCRDARMGFDIGRAERVRMGFRLFD